VPAHGVPVWPLRSCLQVTVVTRAFARPHSLSSLSPLQRSEIAGLESKLGEARAQLSSYATSLHHRDRELASAVQFATQTVRAPTP
jgi:hypothetical protein